MRFLRASLASLLFILAVFPYTALAQTELRDTIRGALLSDPRTFDMPPQQVEAMVDMLLRAAEERGITPEDITWRPQQESSFMQTSECGEGFICGMTDAFGITGDDYTILIMLGASALMLIFLIAAVLEYRHVHREETPPPTV